MFVLTDIENEPDDAQSMVRFLTFSNQFDVEGLVATTSIHQRDKTAAWRIREIVEAYGKVRDNLELHEPGYPTAAYLLSVLREGLPAYGMQAVGEGKDSPGSEALVAAADRNDPRPLWVPVWGGPNVLAQALWKVRATRTPDQLERFVSKLRVYTISDQDDSGPWLRKTFPGLFYIVSPGVGAAGAYHHATWSGISGDRFSGRFAGADFSIVDNPWLDANVRRKGPLGAQYPHTEYLMEGDTPSFLYLFPNGLGDPAHPDWGSWGGATSSTRHARRSGSWNPRRARSGPTRPMRSWATTATGTRRTRPRSGVGGRPTRTSSPRAWTGRSSRTPRPIIRPWRSSAIKPS